MNLLPVLPNAPWGAYSHPQNGSIQHLHRSLGGATRPGVIRAGCQGRTSDNAYLLNPYLPVYGARNGPKSTVSVSRKATQWARPGLFGQFLETVWNTPNGLRFVVPRACTLGGEMAQFSALRATEESAIRPV
jgi:hypothetical protein